jgi:5-bromo-4-chloroindolyl phosphate hydrolysis protein
MTKPLQFDQILHNEPIYYLEQKWQRRLDDHEKNLASELYVWFRTNLEAEEVRIIEELRK